MFTRNSYASDLINGTRGTVTAFGDHGLILTSDHGKRLVFD